MRDGKNNLWFEKRVKGKTRLRKKPKGSKLFVFYI